MKWIVDAESIDDLVLGNYSVQDMPLTECKDCKHRPKGTGANHDLEFPDHVCPCQCTEDNWYSWKPKDDWFCADGKRREE